MIPYIGNTGPLTIKDFSLSTQWVEENDSTLKYLRDTTTGIERLWLGYRPTMTMIPSSWPIGVK